MRGSLWVAGLYSWVGGWVHMGGWCEKERAHTLSIKHSSPELLRAPDAALGMPGMSPVLALLLGSASQGFLTLSAGLG